MSSNCSWLSIYSVVYWNCTITHSYSNEHEKLIQFCTYWSADKLIFILSVINVKMWVISWSSSSRYTNFKGSDDQRCWISRSARFGQWSADRRLSRRRSAQVQTVISCTTLSWNCSAEVQTANSWAGAGSATSPQVVTRHDLLRLSPNITLSPAPSSLRLAQSCVFKLGN